MSQLSRLTAAGPSGMVQRTGWRRQSEEVVDLGGDEGAGGPGTEGGGEQGGDLVTVDFEDGEPRKPETT